MVLFALVVSRIVNQLVQRGAEYAPLMLDNTTSNACSECSGAVLCARCCRLRLRPYRSTDANVVRGDEVSESAIVAQLVPAAEIH